MPPLTIQQALDLARRHHQAGRFGQAEPIYRQILARQPQHADALHLLGVLAQQTGRNELAVELLRRAIALRPNDADSQYNLGTALQAMGQMEPAITAYRQAVALNAKHHGAYNNLGNVLKAQGRVEEASAAYHQAIALKPDFFQAHGNLGNVLKAQGRVDQAIAAYRQALALKPNSPEVCYNLGATLKDKGLLDEASAICLQAIAIDPTLAAAHVNLGNVLKDMGCLNEAITAYRMALQLKPDLAVAGANLLYTLYFHPDYDAQVIGREHRRWTQQHAAPLQKWIRLHSNNRDPDRWLRIGYVSPDFLAHPIGRFLLPLLANHDRQGVEVFAYSQVTVPDAMTERLRAHTDCWRSLVGLSDTQAAELIRQDRIDILVDLTLHMANSRLLVFAHKPAPVQVTYLAYAGSSGLTTMDYRLSDPYLDPPGMDEAVYSEQTLRLPETYWCYQAVVDWPLQPPPAVANGFITFGCPNNFCKINEQLLNLWAKMLAAVPQARLLLHTREGSHRQRVLDHLQRQGIAAPRVNFVGKMPTAEYFQQYQAIDIALHTHPYGGGTTTCDALWMGVPVVSLAGKKAVGRRGLSILSNLGLPDLVADTPQAYVHRAVDLANDLSRLRELRATLRRRLEASPLMDAPRFARTVEVAYRQMWRKWCATCPN